MPVFIFRKAMEQTWLDEDTALKAAARKGWGFESLLLRHFTDMKILVGITTSDLTSLDHKSAAISSPAGLTVIDNQKVTMQVPPGKALIIAALVDGMIGDDALEYKTDGQASRITKKKLLIKPSKGSSLSVNTITREYASGRSIPVFNGEIEPSANDFKLRISLRTDLDIYLKGVLQSEVPASYPLEAIKAQAVAARTYALRPRINHMKRDGINVCDSYLCCQYFGGTKSAPGENHLKAISQTAGQVLTFNSEPVLALFSSNAGGHTEDYDNCFSDPDTKEFPPLPLTYLKGVWETKSGNAPKDFDLSQEKQLRLFYAATPFTEDKTSAHYRWKVNLSANQLESHLHNNVRKLLANPEAAPYIVPPKSSEFGHINGFSVNKRGSAGTIVELSVSTSSGNWIVRKELVIRDFFAVPPAGLKRLKSARIFFDENRDKSGLLSALTICGTGWGHGVGMQQSGACAFAKIGLDYRSILNHYYARASIDKV